LAFETYTGLTGSGLQSFSGAYFATEVGIYISAHGLPSTDLDGVAHGRFAKLGYVCTYNHLVGFSPFPDGYDLQSPIWANSLYHEYKSPNGYPIDPDGADGFFYYFYPGVTATVIWSY
jgi:hypothetical protein